VIDDESGESIEPIEEVPLEVLTPQCKRTTGPTDKYSQHLAVYRPIDLRVALNTNKQRLLFLAAKGCEAASL